MPLTRTVKNNNRSNCSTLSCTFPCRWFAWLQRETSRKLPGFHFLWRKCGTCSCSLFPLPLIFFSSAIRFVSVRCSLGKLDLFKNYKGFNIIFPIDWPRSNSTIPPIASAALSRGRGRGVSVTWKNNLFNPARLPSWWSVKVNSVSWWASDYRTVAMGLVEPASKMANWSGFVDYSQIYSASRGGAWRWSIFLYPDFNSSLRVDSTYDSKTRQNATLTGQ